jgi:DNA-binding SARP family transcriptional activator
MLGDFKVSVGPSIVEKSAWHLRKATALIKLLSLAPDHRLHRERAMELLWPGHAKKAASNNLRQTLLAARRVLDPTGGSRYLVGEDDSLVMCPEGNLWVDVDAFEEAALTARRSKSTAASPSKLQKLLEREESSSKKTSWTCSLCWSISHWWSRRRAGRAGHATGCSSL